MTFNDRTNHTGYTIRDPFTDKLAQDFFCSVLNSSEEEAANNGEFSSQRAPHRSHEKEQARSEEERPNAAERRCWRWWYSRRRENGGGANSAARRTMWKGWGTLWERSRSFERRRRRIRGRRPAARRRTSRRKVPRPEGCRPREGDGNGGDRRGRSGDVASARTRRRDAVVPGETSTAMTPTTMAFVLERAGKAQTRSLPRRRRG